MTVLYRYRFISLEDALGLVCNSISLAVMSRFLIIPRWLVVPHRRVVLSRALSHYIRCRRLSLLLLLLLSSACSVFSAGDMIRGDLLRLRILSDWRFYVLVRLLKTLCLV